MRVVVDLNTVRFICPLISTTKENNAHGTKRFIQFILCYYRIMRVQFGLEGFFFLFRHFIEPLVVSDIYINTKLNINDICKIPPVILQIVTHVL